MAGYLNGLCQAVRFCALRTIGLILLFAALEFVGEFFSYLAQQYDEGRRFRVDYFFYQRCEGNIFIITAKDENLRFVKSFEGGNSALRGCGDGIVVISYSVQFPYEFEAMGQGLILIEGLFGVIRIDAYNFTGGQRGGGIDLIVSAGNPEGDLRLWIRRIP